MVLIRIFSRPCPNTASKKAKHSIPRKPICGISKPKMTCPDCAPMASFIILFGISRVRKRNGKRQPVTINNIICSRFEYRQINWKSVLSMDRTPNVSLRSFNPAFMLASLLLSQQKSVFLSHAPEKNSKIWPNLQHERLSGVDLNAIENVVGATKQSHPPPSCLKECLCIQSDSHRPDHLARGGIRQRHGDLSLIGL